MCRRGPEPTQKAGVVTKWKKLQFAWWLFKWYFIEDPIIDESDEPYPHHKFGKPDPHAVARENARRRRVGLPTLPDYSPE